MAHLAGREAGHHTVLKAQGGIDVIDRALGTATTGGGKPHHRCLRQFQHKIDVMDHQIQHHRHIVGPIGVGAVATALENHHLLIGHHLGEFTKGGVEPLDMTHLQQTARLAGRFDQCGGLVLAGGDRLFDQHMQPRLEAGQTNGVMQQGGHGNADRFHLAEHRAVVSEPAAAELLHRHGTAIAIGISHTDKFGVLEQTQHPGVVPTHVSNADDPDLDRTHGVGRHRQTGVIAGRLSGFSPLLQTHPEGPVGRVRSEAQPWR